MTIKVKDASQRVAVPASPAQIAEIQTDLGILSTDNVQGLIQANASLGALAAPVQTIVDFASGNDRARANHTGMDPAGNVSVTLPTGVATDLQTYINALEIRLTTLGTTAPQNTVQPTAPTGTLTVGSTLTAVTGTWTGASTYNYVWYRVNTTSGALTATGGIAATYVLQAADAGFKMAVSIAGVSSAGIVAAPVISAVTASAIGATLPTISVAPAVTPSGSQAVGVLLTSTTGTWNNASGAVYTYQWTLDGAAISGATSNTYTLITGQEGKAVVCRVLATTTQGPAAASAASNTITVASTPVLTNSAAPSFTGTVTEGTPNAIIPGTWSQTVDASRTWRIYIAAGSGGLITPYAQITGTSGTYTALNDNFFQTQTGLSVIAGQSVYVDEVVTYLGVPYTSPKSTVKVIAAISATLATTADNTGMSWTQNSAITSIKPVSATGGTLPYSYAITPSTTALPAGLTISSSTGIISGTPTAISGSTTYSITVTDAVGAFSAKTWTASVAAASSISPMAFFNAKDPFSTMSGSIQGLGTGYSLSGVNETTGITGTGTIALPAGSSTMRFGKINDPLNSSRKVIVAAGKNTDPPTANHAGRMEIIPSGSVLAKTGTTYWIGFELYVPISRYAAGAGNLFQIHNSTQDSLVFGPFALIFTPAGYLAPNACVCVDIAWSSQSIPGNPGYNIQESYPYISDNPGFLPPAGQAAYPVNQWVKWVFKYRGDPTGGTGFLTGWMNGTQVFTRTGINIGTATGPDGANTDYAKIGFDDYQNGGGSAGAYELIRSFYQVQDNGSYTESDIRALLV